MWGDHWMFGGFMWLFWLLVIVAIVAVIWSASRSRSGADQQPNANEPGALSILERRYAQGEISKDEFEEKKRDLSGHT